MTQLFVTPPVEAIPVACAGQDCQEQVRPDAAIWYDIGISHFNKERGVSYIQIHNSLFSCSEACAVKAAHARADSHKDLPHGQFDAATLNPDGLHPDVLVQQNAVYTPLGVAWASLPKVDALTGAPLGDDIYVPHVDRSSHQDPKRGVHGYHTPIGFLGTATLESCIQLIHVIIDEILAPAPAQEPTETAEATE